MRFPIIDHPRGETKKWAEGGWRWEEEGGMKNWVGKRGERDTKQNKIKRSKRRKRIEAEED